MENVALCEVPLGGLVTTRSVGPWSSGCRLIERIVASLPKRRDRPPPGSPVTYNCSTSGAVGVGVIAQSTISLPKRHRPP